MLSALIISYTQRKILAISKATMKVSLGLKSKFFKMDANLIELDEDEEDEKEADDDDDEASAQDHEVEAADDEISVEELAEADDSDSDIEAMIKVCTT